MFITGCEKANPPQPYSENLMKKKFKYKAFEHEDKYIMFALEFDRQGQKEEARELYKRLYENTSNDEYLLEYIKISFALKSYDDILSIVDSNIKNIEDKKLEIKKIYILSLMQMANLDKALVETRELLKLEEIDRNYELLGNIYIQKEQYTEATKLFEQLYKKDLNPRYLLSLVNVMYIYLDEKKEAINLLESHTQMHGCQEEVCSRLLTFYQEEKNIDGIIRVLKNTYIKAKNLENNLSLDRVYKLLMYYLEKKDINEAIKFLEESTADNEKLLNLYRSSNNYKKAYDLANKLYKESSNIDYLAQIAMIEFEMTENKKDVLASVIKKFEDVLVVLDNHVYQNYLGYILIDFDIDVKKGLSLVKKALEKAPHNLAYIDSLAWGQYKLKDCKKAYDNMKKVVDSAGLDDKEIKLHWEKIKECSK
ncbi:hypothetical protein [Arcobacter arenosus]|uniref:hypothetical protein n=1 Tax=Arcobacter arenosus TaxID=2576037 RepID=UPI003BAB3442